MSGHADTIRPTIRHDRMRVVDTWAHPSTCPGCSAERSLDALLAENQQLRELLTDLLVHHDAGCVSYVPCAIAEEAREALRSEQ